jgi:hypothetical protein
MAPNMEGRTMMMVLAPAKLVKAGKK